MIKNKTPSDINNFMGGKGFFCREYPGSHTLPAQSSVLTAFTAIDTIATTAPNVDSEASEIQHSPTSHVC